VRALEAATKIDKPVGFPRANSKVKQPEIQTAH